MAHTFSPSAYSLTIRFTLNFTFLYFVIVMPPREHSLEEKRKKSRANFRTIRAYAATRGFPGAAGIPAWAEFDVALVTAYARLIGGCMKFSVLLFLVLMTLMLKAQPESKTISESTPNQATQQEPSPIVLTFNKLNDDERCGAADHIAAGIRLEDAGGQVRLTVEPWVQKGDHLGMRMLLAGCGWQAAEKRNSDRAAVLWGAGFVLAALDDALDSQRLAHGYNDALAAYRADEKYIASANQYIWELEDAARVPHAFAASPAYGSDASMKSKQTNKRVFVEALRGALVGAAQGYADYQRALVSSQPVRCTGQQMGWLFSFSCQ
jgi:hypothetical protein